MKNSVYFMVLATLLLSWGIASAGDDLQIVPPDETRANRTINLPYAFYNESFGAAAAYVYSVVGYPQKQSAVLATAMAGTKGSAMGFLMARDIQMPGGERLFLDPTVSVGYFVDNNAFINGNPAYVGQRAGSNNSDKNNYISGDGLDTFLRFKFKYLLPIGNGSDQVITDYKLKGGLLESGASGASGGESWHPLASGRTFVELRPFYRSQQINSNYVDSNSKTNGLDFSLFWDNRDFPANPSYGNSLRFRTSRDFGAFDSSNSWTVMEGEADQYFSLGSSDWFRQRVIALDVWTANSPTWKVAADSSIANRPPTYTGATLGGLFKMRGYPTQRFSDKAAIYYAAEYRMIPDWNPFAKWPFVQKHLGVQWVQFAPFVEIGRVAPDWDVNTLHKNMKWDVGLSARAMAKGLVVRIDVARSNEDTRIQMMVGHPFQF